MNRKLLSRIQFRCKVHRVSEGIKNLSMKLYENDLHEILNEPDKEVVFEDLMQWMKKRI